MLEERGQILTSLLSLADASAFAAERKARGLDRPLRRFDERATVDWGGLGR